jgi:hypothetical protein
MLSSRQTSGSSVGLIVLTMSANEIPAGGALSDANIGIDVSGRMSAGLNPPASANVSGSS